MRRGERLRRLRNVPVRAAVLGGGEQVLGSARQAAAVRPLGRRQARVPAPLRHCAAGVGRGVSRVGGGRRFGAAVSFDGETNTLVVGAPRQTVAGRCGTGFVNGIREGDAGDCAEAGAVYVFQKDFGGQNNWGQVQLAPARAPPPPLVLSGHAASLTPY